LLLQYESTKIKHYAECLTVFGLALKQRHSSVWFAITAQSLLRLRSHDKRFSIIVNYVVLAVIQPDRSCQVAVDSEQKFLLPSSLNNRTDGGDVICGSRDRAWLLEAPSGQRINVSLLDLSDSSSSRTVETAPSLSWSRCLRQLGFIEDKSANRNVNICTDNAQPTIYVSRSNQLAIVLASRRQQTPGNFLISVKGLSNSFLIISEESSTIGQLFNVYMKFNIRKHILH